MGNCLAGDGCPFSHDPSALISNLSVSSNSRPVSPAPSSLFQVDTNSDAFPPLSSAGMEDQWANQYNNRYPSLGSKIIPPGLHPGMGRRNGSMTHLARPNSRPTSRHQSRPELNPAASSVDDPDAFPTLGSLAAKRGSKHHGHRSRHGHSSTEKESPSSLADVVRMSPSPAPVQMRKLDAGRKVRSHGGIEGSTGRKIPEPQHIPWLETGLKANQQYLKHRAEAIKHGSVRNKFLQR